MARRMNRYRIVTQTTTADGTETHVSSVVLSAAEALADISTEESLARAAGWRTEPLGDGIAVELVCTLGDIVRTLTIRESGPFDDAI